MAFSFFCPTCANLLVVDVDSGQPLFKCQTCPYIYTVDREISRDAQLRKKEVDDVLGGSDAWKNVQTTTGWQDLAFCEKFFDSAMEMLWCCDNSMSAVRF
ncbi:hypothetical protein CVIRNUC_006525 [Coccomyxa viridis]|uniref:DNA-directed RNA polymerase II subunit RPB9-like zinc ribbon domain-containing protein n=1 Tax=Coccomyxa viridis TaxID=1274662 RepID=A0AAV1I8Z3_9CHLO|nr:hypothetical protein CVIRNUC_006525 [Coccomyxa viridis]